MNRLGKDLNMLPVQFRSIEQDLFHNELKKPEYRIWTSHPSGGFRKWDQLFKCRPGMKKITMLRNPFQRYVSHYYYNLKKLADQNITLEDTLTQPVERHFLVDNVQTKIIAADARSFDYSLPATSELLEKAKVNLSQEFVFFGLVEYFEPSYRLLGHTFNFVPSAEPLRLNTNPVADYLSNVSGKLRDRIEAYNMCDMEFYRFACNLFRERIELMKEKISAN